MFIIKHRKIFIGISATLVVISLALLIFVGLRVGIDFRGGAITEVVFQEDAPPLHLLEEKIATLSLGSVLVQPTGEGYLIKTRDLSEAEHTALLKLLSEGDEDGVREIGFNSIGPSVGRELTRKAIVAIVLVSVTIILFIAFAFRKVSYPVSSWKYGLIAVTTLLHDVAIPVGLFVVLSRYFGAELDTLFVVGILTILGLSVSDTIVIFDRIRENLKEASNNTKQSFDEIVGTSIKQSYARSIATSLTLILVLLSLFFFGPSSTRYFALLMTAGMFVGTYSSIFLASPLLVMVWEWQGKGS